MAALAVIKDSFSRHEKGFKKPLVLDSNLASVAADVEPSLDGSTSDEFESTLDEGEPGLIGVPRLDLGSGVSLAPDIFKDGTSFSLEEQIAGMIRKLPDTDSNQGKALERAYQNQIAKQRAVIPHIKADVIQELFLRG